MKYWQIVLIFSLISFVPVCVIGWMNMPTGVEVIPDKVKYLKKEEVGVIELKEVKIEIKRPVRIKKKVEEKKEACFEQESMNGGRVKVCP